MKHHADAARETSTEATARHKPARGKEPKLTDAQREYIVPRLAAYERPSRIRRSGSGARLTTRCA